MKRAPLAHLHALGPSSSEFIVSLYQKQSFLSIVRLSCIVKQ